MLETSTRIGSKPVTVTRRCSFWSQTWCQFSPPCPVLPKCPAFSTWINFSLIFLADIWTKWFGQSLKFLSVQFRQLFQRTIFLTLACKAPLHAHHIASYHISTAAEYNIYLWGMGAKKYAPLVVYSGQGRHIQKLLGFFYQKGQTWPILAKKWQKITA